MRIKPNSVDNYMEEVQLPPGNGIFKTKTELDADDKFQH